MTYERVKDPWLQHLKEAEEYIDQRIVFKNKNDENTSLKDVCNNKKYLISRL